MDRCYEISWSVAERLDQPMLNWQRAMMRAMCAQLAGDTDEAEARATEAFRIGSDGGQPDASADLRRATRTADGSTGNGRRTDPTDRAAGGRAARTDRRDDGGAGGDLRLSGPTRGRASSCWNSSQQRASSLRPTPGTWLLTMTNYADVCVACRDTTIAATLFDRLEPFADQVPTNILSA